MVERIHFVLFSTLLLSCALLPAAADAHPHVWVDYRVSPRIDGGRLTALDEEWVFDSQFSSMLLNDSAPGWRVGGALTPAIVRHLHDHAFMNLGHYGFFTQVWAGGKQEGFGPSRGFAATMTGDRLVYRFTLPLKPAVDPRKEPVEIGIWDTSYYVDLEPAKPSAKAVALPAESGCKATVGPDRNRPIYFGTVIPTAIRITCP
ncbi:MAG: DUF1007 family protein [Paracoccaceae bacterium]|nr:DUF1007 family protein [Paracoccaceae bacterium]